MRLSEISEKQRSNRDVGVYAEIFKAWRPVAHCSTERLAVRSAPPRADKRQPDACILESHPVNRPAQPTAYCSHGVVSATAGFPIPVCASSVAGLLDTWA